MCVCVRYIIYMYIYMIGHMYRQICALIRLELHYMYTTHTYNIYIYIYVHTNVQFCIGSRNKTY